MEETTMNEVEENKTIIDEPKYGRVTKFFMERDQKKAEKMKQKETAEAVTPESEVVDEKKNLIKKGLKIAGAVAGGIVLKVVYNAIKSADSNELPEGETCDALPSGDVELDASYSDVSTEEVEA